MGPSRALSASMVLNEVFHRSQDRFCFNLKHVARPYVNVVKLYAP